MTVQHPTVPAASTGRWRDGKRYLWLIGLVVPSLAFIGYRHERPDRLGDLVLDRPDRDPGGGARRSTWWPASTAPTRPTT